MLVAGGRPVDVGTMVGARETDSVGVRGAVPHPVRSNENRVKKIAARVINPLVLFRGGYAINAVKEKGRLFLSSLIGLFCNLCCPGFADYRHTDLARVLHC